MFSGIPHNLPFLAINDILNPLFPHHQPLVNFKYIYSQQTARLKNVILFSLYKSAVHVKIMPCTLSTASDLQCGEQHNSRVDSLTTKQQQGSSSTTHLLSAGPFSFPHTSAVASALITLFLSGAKISVENYVGQTRIVGLLTKFIVK